MKYCPECGKKISKKDQSKSKHEGLSKNKKDSTKKKSKSNKKTNSKKTNSKKKKQKKKNKLKLNRNLILGLSLFLILILVLGLYFILVIPSTTNFNEIPNTSLIKIDSKSIEELTESDIASEYGYFCRIKTDSGIYYIKQSEIKSLKGLDKPFLAKVKLKKLSNNEEIYTITEVYDLEGNIL